MILWLAGGPLSRATAMSFFAALLFHVVTQRAGSPLLLVPSVPALITPLIAVALWPQAGILPQGVLLVFTGLAGLQAGRMLIAGGAVAPVPKSFAAPRPAPAPRPPPPITAADGELSLEALTEAKAEAEAANQAKSAFLAMATRSARPERHTGMTQALAPIRLSPAQLGRLTVIRSRASRCWRSSTTSSTCPRSRPASWSWRPSSSTWPT